MTRDKRPSKIASVGRFFQQVLWTDLLSLVQSSEEKLNMFTNVINVGLNTIMPVSTIKIHESDRPWMNTNLKQLIVRRQKAFTSGNESLYKVAESFIIEIALKPVLLPIIDPSQFGFIPGSFHVSSLASCNRRHFIYCKNYTLRLPQSVRLGGS